MKSRFAPAVTVLAVVALMLVPAGNVAQVAASGASVQSSISVYINCPGAISFAEPGASSSCGAGNYTAVYTGISQTVVINKTSVFYLAGSTGGVKVTFGIFDVTTGKPLLNGVGYGFVAGGTCASPSLVTPATVVASTNLINSGDKLRASLNTTFTPTGSNPNLPVYCSGGSNATLVTIGTMVVAGTAQPLLTTMLTAGNPHQTTLSGYSGIAESYTNEGTSSFTAVVIGVVKSSSENTVDVLITSVTVLPGTNATAFLKFNQYPPGAYTVTVLATSSSNVPVSTAEVATATV